MDGRRFDSLARSLATWSTRRRFLGGLTGAAAAGGALIRAGGASAQSGGSNPPVDVLSACLVFTGADSNAKIASTSNDLLSRMPKPSNFDVSRDKHWDRPQLPEFVGQIRCILEQGTHANDGPTGWSDEQRGLFVSQARGILTAISIGFTGAFFTGPVEVPGTPIAESPYGIHALLAQDEKSDCKPSGCLPNALASAFACWSDCNHDSDCYSTCFIDFVTTYFFGNGIDQACATLVKEACGGDCCGVCVP